MSEEIHIIEEEPIKIKGVNVIIGLPDVGLVGLIRINFCLTPERESTVAKDSSCAYDDPLRKTEKARNRTVALNFIHQTL